MEGWKDYEKPVMCSYKLVNASFEVWGFQTRVEDYIQKCIRDVLLLGHRQAFTWMDDWFGMSLDEVREYEKRIQAETNDKMKQTIDDLEKSTDKVTAPVPTTPVNLEID